LSDKSTNKKNRAFEYLKIIRKKISADLIFNNIYNVYNCYKVL